MANLPDHLNQAKHNETLAEKLIAEDLRHWDWLITIAFYAAVHYAEAVFFIEFGHTETACRTGDKHAYRARKVKELFGGECWRSYRKLQTSCYNVRYLGLADRKPGEIAVRYYSLEQAKQMYNDDLTKFREAALGKLNVT